MGAKRVARASMWLIDKIPALSTVVLVGALEPAYERNEPARPAYGSLLRLRAGGPPLMDQGESRLRSRSAGRQQVLLLAAQAKSLARTTGAR